MPTILEPPVAPASMGEVRSFGQRMVFSKSLALDRLGNVKGAEVKSGKTSG